jgi:mycofactocin precursor
MGNEPSELTTVECESETVARRPQEPVKVPVPVPVQDMLVEDVSIDGMCGVY